MSKTKWTAIVVVLLGLPTAFVARNTVQTLKDGAKSYLFGYSLVLMDATRQSMTDPDRDRVPLNHFSHVQYFPDHEFRQVVRPNNDTLYSTAWIDLSKQPLVLSVPAVKDRYYVMPFMDAWTNVFASVGTRTTGSEAGNYVVAGPEWQGEVPDDLTLIRSPTNMTWLIGRIQTNTESDFDNVAKLQKQFSLTTLSDWGKSKSNRGYIIRRSEPQIAGDNPSARVEQMSADVFFSKLSRLMAEQPPAEADRPMLARLAKFGVEPGKPFEIQRLGFFQRWLLQKSMDLSRSKLEQTVEQDCASENGWAVVREGIGVYGDQYQVRSFVSKVGLGALPPEEAAYPNAKKDQDGRPLSGRHHYRVHFDAGQTPPVDAFWSLTVYDENGFLIDNPIKRYTLGDRDSLMTNEDGSVNILIQHAQPEEKISNWLPSPAGPFAVTMRLYLPKPEFLDGSWKLPPIERID